MELDKFFFNFVAYNLCKYCKCIKYRDNLPSCIKSIFRYPSKAGFLYFTCFLSLKLNLVSSRHSILVSCVGSEPARLFLSLFWLESKINKNSQKSKSTISNLIKLYFSGNTLHTKEKIKTNQNFAFFSKKVNKISDTNL